MRLLAVFLIILLGSCKVKDINSSSTSSSGKFLENSLSIAAYFPQANNFWESASIPADTEIQILDAAPVLSYPGRHRSWTLFQAALIKGDSCWIPISWENHWKPSRLLDSIRRVQTAQALLEEADFRRYQTYCQAIAGEVQRPFHFLITEGDRLAKLLEPEDAVKREMLELMERVAGPILPAYQLIIRSGQPQFVRYWPKWEALAKAETAEDWHQDLIHSLRTIYNKDSLADPQSLVWWLYTEEGERFHRLGDTSTITNIQVLELLVEKQAPAFALALDLTDQALRPLAAEDIRFWNDQASILWELDSILATDWTIIAERERIALGVLRNRLAAPDTSGIELDHRSGRYD